VAKIELPESWASVAEPLRALMAEVEREAQADSATAPNVAAVSAQWARVRCCCTDEHGGAQQLVNH
jgi:hypothetical protein